MATISTSTPREINFEISNVKDQVKKFNVRKMKPRKLDMPV